MGLALELFLVIGFVTISVGGVVLFLSRDILKRGWKILVEKDRAEQRILDERKLEVENRTLAEKEIDETLNVYSDPRQSPRIKTPHNESEGEIQENKQN